MPLDTTAATNAARSYLTAQNGAVDWSATAPGSVERQVHDAMVNMFVAVANMVKDNASVSVTVSSVAAGGSTANGTGGIT